MNAKINQNVGGVSGQAAIKGPVEQTTDKGKKAVKTYKEAKDSKTGNIGNVGYEDVNAATAVVSLSAPVVINYVEEKGNEPTKVDSITGRITVDVPEGAETVTAALDETCLEVSKIPAEEPTEVRIDKIYYDFDEWYLRGESKTELDKIIPVLQKKLEENSGTKIYINAHTDEEGSDEYNVILSLKRAQSVVDYLVSKGISANSLVAYGYGESLPIVRGARTEEEHQMNRRTTYKVIGAKTQTKEAEFAIKLIAKTTSARIDMKDAGGKIVETEALPGRDIKIIVSNTANAGETGGVIFHEDTDTFELVANKNGKIVLTSADGKITKEFIVDELKGLIISACLEARQNEQKILRDVIAEKINASVMLDASMSTSKWSAAQKTVQDVEKDVLKTGAGDFDEYSSFLTIGSSVDVRKSLSSLDIEGMVKTLKDKNIDVNVTQNNFSGEEGGKSEILEELKTSFYLDSGGKITPKGYHVLLNENDRITFKKPSNDGSREILAKQALQSAVISKFYEAQRSDLPKMVEGLSQKDSKVIVAIDDFQNVVTDKTAGAILKKLKSGHYLGKNGEMTEKGYKILTSKRINPEFAALFKNERVEVIARQALRNAVISKYFETKSDILEVVHSLKPGGTTRGWEAVMEQYKLLDGQRKKAERYFEGVTGTKNAEAVSVKQIDDAIASNQFDLKGIADLERVKNYIEQLEQKTGNNIVEISKKEFIGALLPDNVTLVSDMKFNGEQYYSDKLIELMSMCDKYKIEFIAVEVPEAKDRVDALAQVKSLKNSNKTFESEYLERKGEKTITPNGEKNLSEMRQYMYLFAKACNGAYLIAPDSNVFSGINAAKEYIVKTKETEINLPSAEYDKLNLELPAGSFIIPVVGKGK